MPHYFFHVYQAERRIEDHEGTDCGDMSDAKEYAVDCARELASQAVGNGTPPSTLCVEIADEAGHTWPPSPSRKSSNIPHFPRSNRIAEALVTILCK
jgi:hypothetical protein